MNCAVWSDLTVHQMSDLHRVSPQIKISTPRGIFLFLKENVPVKAQLTILQFLKSEAATTVRSKMVSCFTQNLEITKKINTMHNLHLSKNTQIER